MSFLFYSFCYNIITMSNNTNKKMFIFDFDGTIADTHQYIIDIYNSISTQFGSKPIKQEDVLFLKTKTVKEVINFLNVSIFKIPSLLKQSKKEFHKNIHTLKPFDDLKDVLIQLKNNNIILGIISSNSSKNVSTFLKNHQLNFFSFINTTHNIWSKERLIKKVISEYPISLDSIFYIGDEVRDINSAKKINIKSIAVSWGYNDISILKKYSPDYLISSPNELLNI